MFLPFFSQGGRYFVGRYAAGMSGGGYDDGGKGGDVNSQGDTGLTILKG